MGIGCCVLGGSGGAAVVGQHWQAAGGVIAPAWLTAHSSGTLEPVAALALPALAMPEKHAEGVACTYLG